MSNILKPQIDCSTAEEFMEALSPIGKYFKNQELNSPWLFRGQGKDYPLIPSLFRKDENTRDKFKLLTKRNIDEYEQLCEVEMDFLVQFFEIADKRGLILPDDSQELRSNLEMVKSSIVTVMNGCGEWLASSNLWSLVALAQHSGIPTRLLDWTQQAFTAAFFAAETGAREFDNKTFESSDQLVVWAFYFPGFGRITSHVPNEYSIRGITAPSATNLNLKAQQGIFTLIHPRHSNEKSGAYLPFQEILQNIASEAYRKRVENCELRKFTLPITKAPDLLHILAKLDITPSVIYPGYHSIISDMQNQKRWL